MCVVRKCLSDVFGRGLNNSAYLYVKNPLIFSDYRSIQVVGKNR